MAAPPDAPQALHRLRALLTGRGQRLLAELRDLPPAEELSAATRLRRHHPAALVSAAIGQARLRQRAAAKFGPDAALMYFTPDGVEQATRAPVAAWRAERFAALGTRRVADLCCGIGGDAIALARAGMDVLAVDRDPLTCAVAEANAAALGLAARITVRCADVTDAEGDLASRDALLIDPARRTARGRTFDPGAYSPPLARALALAERVPFAAVKVAPGIPHAVIPPAVAETEWVSHGGDVKEAVLWLGTGAGQEGPRRATLLPGPHTMTGTGPPAPTGPLGRYLYEPDGAVIRAHLIAELAHQLSARLPDPSIAYLTTDGPSPSPTPTPTPFATAYEITDALPFNVKRLRALLRERGIGTVTIKKRGTAVTPEELRSKLRLQGANSCTIILTRIAGAPKMLLGHPVEA